MTIAGGFGMHLNLESAATVGLFSPELLAATRIVGNAAIEGATGLAASQEACDAFAQIVDSCSYLELSAHRKFNEYFMECMEFPEL